MTYRRGKIIFFIIRVIRFLLIIFFLSISFYCGNEKHISLQNITERVLLVSFTEVQNKISVHALTETIKILHLLLYLVSETFTFTVMRSDIDPRKGQVQCSSSPSGRRCGDKECTWYANLTEVFTAKCTEVEQVTLRKRCAYQEWLMEEKSRGLHQEDRTSKRPR